ncbi:MAG: hypothetical protein ACRD96_17650, partial [Bryobacteraceae bacterium]
MLRWITCALLVSTAGAQDDDELIGRIRSRMRDNLSRLPDFVCSQTVERSRRGAPTEPFKPLDTLRLEVAFVGDRELYAWPDSSRFESKELNELIGSGVIGTGAFALHARNVFLAARPEFTAAGPAPLDGRPALKFDYLTLPGHGSYRLRVGRHQASVTFHGAFWVDPGSLDLLRLEVEADAIPEQLGLAEARNVMEYARLRIGDSEFLLPKAAELTMLGTLGEESRNRITLAACRQYVGESSLSFEDPDLKKLETKARPETGKLPPRRLIELTLDADIAPETAAAGDAVRALVAEPVRDGTLILIPKGAVAHGRLVRIEKHNQPVDHYIVALTFHTIEAADRQIPLSATMEKAGPAAGLMRQARSLNPTFDKRRLAKMDILVRETQKGHGVLYWEARRP